MKRLYRSNDRMLAGVLGGIAAYFGLDPTMVRLGYAVGLVLSVGGLILLYILAIFIIPNEWEVR